MWQPTASKTFFDKNMQDFSNFGNNFQKKSECQNTQRREPSGFQTGFSEVEKLKHWKALKKLHRAYKNTQQQKILIQWQASN